MDEAAEDSTNVQFKKAARMRALQKMLSDPDSSRGRFRDPADLFGKKT